METAKTDEKLHMLFDGELSPEEEADLRRMLEGTSEGMEELRQWERIREGMQGAAQQWTADLNSDALFARIEAAIAEKPESIDVENAAPRVYGPRPLRVVPGGRERRIWGGVTVGIAAAAAVFLAVMSWPKEPGSRPTQAFRGTEVVEVDFGHNAGTVFNVRGSAGESLAVIWIDDEEAGMP